VNRQTPLIERLGSNRLGVALVAAFALLCAFAIWPSSNPLPRDVRAGRTLAGVMVAGQSAYSAPGGLRIEATHGPWARVHFGPEDEQGRWIHFAHVTAFSVAAPSE